MLFSSFPYILLFLPVTVLLCVLARRLWGARAAQLWVLAASVSFYFLGKPSSLPYLAASVLVNWLAVRAMDGAGPRSRKRMLVGGLIFNIGYLSAFKYVNFFLANLPLLGRLNLHLPELEFPLGISFFTLAQIIYLVDSYEGLVSPVSLLDHATFVAFFPYVISGPIAKAKNIFQQFANFGGDPNRRSELAARGAYLFAIGLFKKVMFADCFALIANFGFSSTATLSALEAWIFSIAYTFQIYFDFSGYSDMAIGTALMFGIEIPRNFDAPLRSQSIIEFWQRWHISLSQFITTYLYTPVLKAFSRATLATAGIATVLTMAIAGLWHGPRWTFVVFGTLHGIGLTVNQYWRKKKMRKLPGLLCWLLTFVLVNVTFIFFRSEDLSRASHMSLSLVNPHSPFGFRTLAEGRELFGLRIFGPGMLAGALLAFFGKSSGQLAQGFRPSYGNCAAIALMTVLCFLFMGLNDGQPFLYFKF